MLLVGLIATAVASAGVVTVLVPSTQRSAASVGRARVGAERVCARVTFGRTTFRLIVSGVGCTTAVAVVERLQMGHVLPRGWTCVALHCWRDARSYESARSRIAEQVDVTVEPGPISGQLCVDPVVEITARQYISCPQARRALARYLVLSRLDKRPHRDEATFVNCNGDLATGGYCAVTFPTGAQGHFAYRPDSGAARAVTRGTRARVEVRP